MNYAVVFYIKKYFTFNKHLCDSYCRWRAALYLSLYYYYINYYNPSLIVAITGLPGRQN